MKEHLEHFIRLTLENPIEEEIQDILELFHLEKLEKGQYFKRETEICRKVAFLVKGALRHYAVKGNGEEVTGKITDKNSFITDMMSIRTKEITPISIKALETSTLLVASVPEVERLLETNLTFNRLIREHIADSFLEFGKLYLIFLTGSAKDRYQFILENNPRLLKNFPLRLIATMIGITPTQLSRIRKEKISS